MNTCAICGIEITEENNTREHIIPNCIGGRLMVKDFICRDCNHKTGTAWDKSLNDLFSTPRILSRIKTQRKTCNFVIGDSEHGELKLFNDGSVELAKTKYWQENGYANWRFPNKRKAKESLAKMDKSQIRNIQISKPIINPPRMRSGLSLDLKANYNFSFFKSALALMKYRGVDYSSCNIALSLLRNPEEYRKNIPISLYKQKIIDKTSAMGTHFIYIQGYQKSKLIIAVVHYFDIDFLMFLSDNYVGDDFSCSYFLSLESYRELEEISIKPMPENEISSLLKRAFSIKQYIENLKNLSISNDRTVKLIEDKINKAFPDGFIWEEDLDKAASIVIQELKLV